MRFIFKPGIAEPEDTAVARKQLCKYTSTVINSRDRKNGVNAGGRVFCAARAEAM